MDKLYFLGLNLQAKGPVMGLSFFGDFLIS